MDKKILYSILLATVLVLALAPQVMVLAQSGELGTPNDSSGGAMGSSPGGGGGDSISGIVGKIKDSLSGLGAGLATIAFIIAGIMFLSATGNPSRMTIAKGALVAGVIGIVIILLADGACEFVKTFTGASGSC